MSHHRWCRRCGWKGTYDSPGRANYSKRQHSCERQLARAAAHARGQQRQDSVDRTPKPCHHPRADHQHGTRACYVCDRCRCLPCAKANAEAEQQRERAKAYGRYDKYIDAEPVRAHVRALSARGMGWKRVAAAAGVSTSSMWKLLYGKRRADGTQKPSARILRTNGERLLAVRLDVADGALVHHPVGVTRRMQALVALGWSQQKLATRLGISRSNFRLTSYQWAITSGTAARAIALYDELSMQLPPQEHHRDKIAASRARGYAAQRGWVPPLAWDDDTIDDPDAAPDPSAVDSGAAA